MDNNSDTDIPCKLQSNYDQLQSNYDKLQSNYDQLQSNYDQLQSNYDQLQSDNDELQSNYDELQSNFDDLQSVYCKLKNDYSENTIIQSMNDMRDRYLKLIQTTVPSYKYQLLSEKYISLVKRSCASCVFIDHILKSFESINIIRENERKEMTKIKFQLVNIREILEDDLSRCINPT